MLQQYNAEVAQLAERNLAKVEVAGSNPVFRSMDSEEPFNSGALVSAHLSWKRKSENRSIRLV